MRIGAFCGIEEVYADAGPDNVFHIVWTDGRNNASHSTTPTRSVSVK